MPFAFHFHSCICCIREDERCTFCSSSERIIMSLEINRRRVPADIGIQNKDFKSDMDYSIYYTRSMLAMLGIWSLVKQNPRKQELIMSIILMTTGLFLLAFVLVPLGIFIAVKVNSFTSFLKMLGPFSFNSGNFAKYCLIIHRRKFIKACFKHVQTDWEAVASVLDREIMKKNATVGRRVSLLSMGLMYSSGLAYLTLIPFWRAKAARAHNITIRPLPYPVYDLYVDSQATPQYEIIFSTSFLMGTVMFTVMVAACSLAAIFVSHVCGQIEIIMSRLDTLFDNLDGNVQLFNTRITFIIRSHVRVLRLVDAVQIALKEILLAEVIASTLVICLLEWRLTQWRISDNVTLSTYWIVLVSVTFNLFIFCYSGQLLIEQCKIVGRAAYLSDWWKMRGKSGQALILLIAISHIPRRLTAGGMLELSMASFGAVIRTSLGYLNMIRTFNG